MRANISDYDPVTMTDFSSTSLAIFSVSTYGESDPIDDTADFCSWINTAGEVSLFSLRYAAFSTRLVITKQSVPETLMLRLSASSTF
jgi:NADPH-ferrihemoprotein reductase